MLVHMAHCSHLLCCLESSGADHQAPVGCPPPRPARAAHDTFQASREVVPPGSGAMHCNAPVHCCTDAGPPPACIDASVTVLLGKGCFFWTPHLTFLNLLVLSTRLRNAPFGLGSSHPGIEWHGQKPPSVHVSADKDLKGGRGC